MATSWGTACVSTLLKVSLQAAVLAALVWAITSLARRAPAAWRNLLWLMVVVKLLVPPFAYYPSQLAFWQAPDRPAASISAQSGDRTASVAAVPGLERSAQVPNDSRANAVAPSPITQADRGNPSLGDRPAAIAASTASPAQMAVLAWLVGVGMMLCLVAVRCAGQVRLVRHSSPAGADLAQMLRRAAESLGVRRLPDLRVSLRARTPMLVGWLKPAILLPQGLGDRCRGNDLKAMLLHELAHVRRHDIAAMWLQQIAQALFYFHPAVWLAGREIRRERELACDELVLSRSAISAKDYAAGYVSALKLANGGRRFATSLAMAEPLDMEKRRLDMILRSAVPRLSARWIAALAAVAAVGLPTFAGLACSRTESAPELLARVTEARAKALAEVKSGRGSLTLATCHADGANQEVTRRAYAVSVAFAGEKFRYTARRIGIGTACDFDAVCDGRFLNTRYLQTGAILRSDMRSQQESIHARSLTRNFDLVDQAYPDLAKVLLYHKGEPRIVGHETIDGSECVVVESIHVFPQKNGKTHTDTRRIWIDPARGYAVPRIQVWSGGREFKQKAILSETNVQLRDCDGIWGPAKYAHAEYRADQKTRKRYLSHREVVTYGRDFALNVPVSDSDLKLPLTAPPGETSQADELREARTLAGLSDVVGPGVTVTLSDSPKMDREAKPDVQADYRVHDTDVRSVVNELLSGGAEAVSVNDQRMVARSSIRCVGPTILVNDVSVQAPFVIRAIGDPEVMESALKMRGGPVENLYLLDMIEVKKDRLIAVPAYRGTTRSHFARPAARKPATPAAPPPLPEPAVTAGPSLPCEGSVTKQFGYSAHPVTGVKQFHAGIDIKAPEGTPIRAVADGSMMVSQFRGPYGNTVIIDHGGGVSTVYAHCSKLAVSAGEKVRRGETIAYVGSSGYSTGPHCHFEKRVDGKPVNPI